MVPEPGGLKLTVPAVWSLRHGLNENADLQAGSAVAQCFVIVISDSNSGPDTAATLGEFSEVARDWLEGPSVRRAGPLELRIGELDALRVEYIAISDDASSSFSHVSVEGPRSFHQIVFWAESSVFESSRTEFDRILQTFEEVP